MKKSILLLTLSSILLLAACNTTEPVKEEEQPTNSTNNEENSVQNQEEEEETVEKAEEDQNNGQSSNTNQEETNNGAEETTHSITYNSKGKEITDSTKQVKSPQQNYTIELLNGFTLTAEEPGRDMVLFDDNNDISMRVETFNNTDIVYDELLANTKDSALAIAPNGQYKEVDLTNTELDESIKKINTFYVELEGESISTILFNKNDKYIRLTIFDDTSDLKDALLKMGLSIQ